MSGTLAARRAALGREGIDGAPVHLRTGGVAPRDGAPTFVLVHGAGMDGTVWAQQTRYLSMRGVNALAIDLPGHGHSGGEALADVPAMGVWLASVIDALAVGPVVLAGHSMGTFICLEVAAERPELVKAVALLGTATSMPVHPDLIDAAGNDLARAASLMTGWSHAAGSRIGHNPTPGMWMTGGVEALVERSGPGVLLTDLTACASYEGAEARAAAVTCPALVVIGHQDKMTPAKAGRAMVAAMETDVEVVDLPAAGHMTPTEEPRAVREAFLRLSQPSK